MLEQELIFLGKQRFALVLTRFRPTARLLRYEVERRQLALQYKAVVPASALESESAHSKRK